MTSRDLNADLGEGFGRWALTDEEGLLSVVIRGTRHVGAERRGYGSPPAPWARPRVAAGPCPTGLPGRAGGRGARHGPASGGTGPATDRRHPEPGNRQPAPGHRSPRPTGSPDHAADAAQDTVAGSTGCDGKVASWAARKASTAVFQPKHSARARAAARRSVTRRVRSSSTASAKEPA
ncbi:hypothetical protein RKD33_001612 [Streptomyces sp. SAI-129]